MYNIYEIVDIVRHTGALEADSMRIGRKYVPMQIKVGLPAILLHEDDLEKALVTSKVMTLAYHGIEYIDIKTENTTYMLEAVTE